MRGARVTRRGATLGRGLDTASIACDALHFVNTTSMMINITKTTFVKTLFSKTLAYTLTLIPRVKHHLTGISKGFQNLHNILDLFTK